MDCAVCPITVRKALERVPGVGAAKVDRKTHRAVVVFDPSKTTPEVLTKATTDAGFPSSLKQVQRHERSHSSVGHLVPAVRARQRGNDADGLVPVVL
jgi:copper chaperone CopZ